MTDTDKTEYLSNEANLISDKMTKLSVDGENWTIVYLDESTGNHWLMDFLHPESHGGGIPRLRLMDDAIKTVHLKS